MDDESADMCEYQQEDEVDGRFTTVDMLFKTGFIYVDEASLRSQVRGSKSLGWSWSSSTQGVRHTAIILHLDGEPRFSVNWGPKTGTSAIKMRGDVEGEITFGVETSEAENTIYEDVLGTISIPDNIINGKIDQILDKLLTFDEKMYHILHCNCRDHVLRVLSEVGVKEDGLHKVKEDIANVRLTAEWFLKELTKRQ